MTITQISKRFDLSADTLRYYERIGMIPAINRTTGGIRDYNEDNCDWIEHAKCMRSAGLPIEALVEYVKLYHEGDHTRVARHQILMEQREQLIKQRGEIDKTLTRLDYKIKHYEESFKTGILSWDD